MASDRRRDRDEAFDDDYADRRRGRGDREPIVRSRPVQSKGLNVPGLVALILGILGLLFSAFPCTIFVGMPIAAVSLVIGIIGIFTAGQSTGRGLPIAGASVSAGALIVGGIWLALGMSFYKKADDRVQKMHEETEQRMQKVREENEAFFKAAENKRLQEAKELREGKAVIVTAEALYEDFDTKPLEAENKYKNKVVEVSGKVHRVDRDRFGRLAVELDAAGDGLVRCEFPREAQAQIERLRPDQQVTIRGRCTGSSGKTVVTIESSILVTRGK